MGEFCQNSHLSAFLLQTPVVVEMALQAGVSTETHIFNLLYRLTGGAASQVPPIRTPQALVLAQEAKAARTRRPAAPASLA